MFRGSGLEKPAVMLHGARRLIGLIVQLGKIVMRRSIPRIDRQRTQECFLGEVSLPRGPLGQRQVDERIEVAGDKRQRRSKLGDRLISPALHEQRDPVVVVGARIARLDQGRALQLAGGFLEQVLLLVEQAKVVVRLGVQLVFLEQCAIVLQRVLEISGAVIVQREIEIVDGR